MHVCVLGEGPGSGQELRMGHLWSSVGYHPAGSQGMESLGPSQEGSYKGSVSLEVGGVPGLRSWPHELLPGRCLPCSDMALNLLSVLKDGHEGGQAFLAPSALSAGSGNCFLWPVGGEASPPGGSWMS